MVYMKTVRIIIIAYIYMDGVVYAFASLYSWSIQSCNWCCQRV